jgi:hypothetical protein
MRTVAATLATIVLCACADRPPSCRQNDGKYYDVAVSRQLTRNGVPHTIDAERGVCVSQALLPKLEAASREVDTYFHEVAGMLKDECEERAFVEWATREKLPFEIRDTKNSDGAYGGRMFLLRSFSRDEIEPNKEKLWNQSPRGAQCKVQRK